MLEDIEAGSIRIWLKNILVAVDDQTIKDLDWKPAVGRYLVRAKYAYIRWANKSYPERTLVELAQELRAIAGETDIKHLPDYAPPSTAELAEATKEIDAAKAELSDGDRITYLTEENEAIDFDLAVSWSVEELSDLLVRETTKFENMPMNMIVKRPDYLGVSKWEFRHGRKPISARIEHESWLADFQDRKIDIRPGDALKCLVTIEHAYGFDNELVSETYTVTTVEAVLVNQIRQASFLQNED